MANKHIKAVLFDLDGTLLDTHELILASMRYATREVLGEEIPEQRLMRKVGQPLATQLWEFSHGDASTHEALLRAYREHNGRFHDGMVRPFEGVRDVLVALQQEGYLLGVVTSKRHDLAMRGLSLFGLDAFMQCVVGSDDCDTHKPDPGPVRLGATLLGAGPDECFYVGDSPYDIQAGNAAGAITVAALWGMFAPEELVAEGPAYCCPKITDTPKVLKQAVSEG